MKLRNKLLPFTSLALVGTIAIPLSLSGCSSEEKVTQCKVTIDLDGGMLDGETGIITREVPKGSIYASLGIPTKNECVFENWEKTSGGKAELTHTINSDVSIKAKWRPSSEPVYPCTIEINLDGGTLGGETGTITKTLPSGTSYSELGIPTKIGFSFLHWLDISTSQPIEQSSLITEDISIKACWGAPIIVHKSASFFKVSNGTISETSTYINSGWTQDIYLINDSQVPYVTIKNLFDEAQYGQWYELTREGNVFIVKNTITSTTDFSVTCAFDIDNQTITFTDYDKFIWYYSDYANNPLASGCGGGAKYEVSRADNYTTGGTYIIDLKQYHIPIYCDSENAYIPYDFCNNIFDSDLTFGVGTKTRSFMFVRNNLYEIADEMSGTNNLSYCYYLYKKMCENEGIDSPDEIFNLEYREFCYNLLALTLDTRFGMTTRPSRSFPGETIEYFPNGAYSAIAQYHDAFVSNQPNISNAAMINIMKNFCDDGGHAGYYGCDVNTLNPWSLSINTVGPEYLHSNQSYWRMREARTAAGHDLQTGYDSLVEVLSSSDDKKDIAWVTFDEFVSATPTYSQITKDNYMYYGTVGMTMRLQQIVNSPESTIKNVVIDLSNNGGGTVYTEHVLASYLCGRDNQCEPQSSLGHGGVTHTIWNPHSKAFSKYTYYADINGDNSYDSQDYLPEGVNVYCIVSDSSFSCGNMLPCHLADCSNCKFIGSWSGGGACYVDSNMHIGLGNVFRSSSNFHSLKYNSTQQSPITVDEGVVADFYHIPCDDQHAMDFFDRNTIIQKIMQD